MDMVGIGIVATFLSMLFVGAFAVQPQSPPSEQAGATCPETGEAARLTLSWDVAKGSMAIGTCDGSHFASGHCRQECLASLHKTYPKMIPSTVIG